MNDPAQRPAGAVVNEIEADRRHERFLIRVLLVAFLVIALFLLVRQVLG